MQKFRVRKTDDITGNYCVADGFNCSETRNYINVNGVIGRCTEFSIEAEAQAAFDLYLEKQKLVKVDKVRVIKNMRKYTGGATRDIDQNKFDYEGFNNPLVDKCYAAYLNKHCQTANGLRDSDNWQSLFGEKHLNVCIKSICRHVVDVRLAHRGYRSEQHIIDSLNAVKFNINAYLLKLLLEIEEQDNGFSDLDIDPGDGTGLRVEL